MAAQKSELEIIDLDWRNAANAEKNVVSAKKNFFSFYHSDICRHKLSVCEHKGVYVKLFWHLVFHQL